MFKKILLLSKQFRKEIDIYKRVVLDSQTPVSAKICYALIIGYAVMPFDVIPDFIPFFGQLDDFILIPLLFVIARMLTPKEIIQKHRQAVESKKLKS
ncbi:MAG TPA: DUF1232 domain-containing protein [Candidatus Woesebacteria bacterium]|nr:DUF1232 domain-containing protein [Candidatus Woesebacteria bacterium]